MNGSRCRPFSASTLAFRCPANCAGTKLLEPHTVGNETLHYRQLVVGGPQPDMPAAEAVYRADSFICQAAIHAGVTTDALGGCGVAQLRGAAHSFVSSTRNGIRSVGFPSTFPKSFSFVELSSAMTCPRDPQWDLLGITAGALVLLWLFATSPPVLFFSTFFMLMGHVALVSDPPSYASIADLVSLLVSRLLPAGFVVYVLYLYCARPLLQPLGGAEPPAVYQLSKTVLYLPPALIGALNNYTFARMIPLERLTPADIEQQPGAKVALGLVLGAVLIIVVCQAWHIRQAGLMPRYLKLYGLMAGALAVLALLPGLRLRIHHYILAILLMPGTALPTRPSLVYQGLLLGLFVNGIARWGFASVIETPGALGERPSDGQWWGTTYPNITLESVSDAAHRNNITFRLWEPQRMAALGVDGVSVLVNDVERWRGYLDEDDLGEFTWHGDSGIDDDGEDGSEDGSNDNGSDNGSDSSEDVFFRFAFLQGSQVGKYSSPGIWLREGGWMAPSSQSVKPV